MQTFTLQNCYGQEKNVPSALMILNRNRNFNKGINKILKMITMT